ncbi:NAD(P)-dependent oxidoreductase [Streptomyces fuscichromogenes]|uniref:6-phosphogluconate dehydrogenase n=1 Tax=Streptomyces fuscichromogenes TaxID=1324013 RepID=A0A918CTA9_9ACTN|nr:NAD(P)-dependent oxidoreductase [Streptomyces fuscichromogenes]GGN19757.1 6-phosphogluconate dehydrogenase [Streptomyces fuscichromogenes]
MRIGFIGPGRMGRPMLERLMAAGNQVTVLVRRPQAQAAAEAAGLSWAGTIEATVRDADVVFIVVLTDEQVRSVCLGPDGAIEAMKSAATLVQHTTSDPATARLLADAAVQRGIKVVDAALSGGPHDVVAGRLTLWVGADEAVLEEVRPLLETYASPILSVGPVGNGQRVKLVNNALFVAQLGLVIDAVRLADSLGLEEQPLLAAVRHGSGTSRALGVVADGDRGVRGIADRLGDLMGKDVTVVREVARNAGVDLGILGKVLSSDAVEETVLRRARTAQ